MEKTEANYLEALDIGYSYDLAKKLERFRSNPVLGYRTAGSVAERQAGQFLAREMERIGFSDVSCDRIDVDAWEFERAELTVEEAGRAPHHFQLGAYQTHFVTDGPESFQLVDVGRGTAADYEGLDVTGKLVLASINQREEWWINYPVYQASCKGARALIAVQDGGYGDVDEKALNAQDIAGPEDAPAFSISRADAAVLKRLMHGEKEITVQFDAVSRIRRDAHTCNIVGRLPGRHKDRYLMLSAHYDSYFDGFQDDNTAISMMLEIGRALKESGYEPENTILFCAMASEEWGVCDSKYDWSTGAYEEVFRVHPEWRGKVIADFNFELPALMHKAQDAIHSTHEYRAFLETFLKKLPVSAACYPEGICVSTPIETWSDDFSIAISGIPSMVNNFSDGSFMETHYHSQFDNDEFYDEKVYRFHHELYGLLLMRMDRLAVAPLNFGELFARVRQSLDREQTKAYGLPVQALADLLEEGELQGRLVYAKICEINAWYDRLLREGNRQEAEELFQAVREMEQTLLALFYQEQSELVTLSWHDDVLFPQETAQNNLRCLEAAIEALREAQKTEEPNQVANEQAGVGDAEQVTGVQAYIRKALEALYEIDNNRYAFQFDEEVYRHFTDYVLSQPESRTKWGTGRIRDHENLYALVRSLMTELAETSSDDSASRGEGESDAVMRSVHATEQEAARQQRLKEARTWLEQAKLRQIACCRRDLEGMQKTVQEMIAKLQTL